VESFTTTVQPAEFRLLGQLEVRIEGRGVEIGRGRSVCLEFRIGSLPVADRCGWRTDSPEL
jgi:hypothetical protein